MSVRFRFAITVAVMVLSASVVFAADTRPADKVAKNEWPQWRGPNRDGISTEKGLLKNWDTPPKLSWIAEGVGGGYASVSISRGRIFTTGNFDDGQYLVAMNASNGKVEWKSLLTDGKPRHDYEGSRSTPTIDGDFIYVVGSGGDIACFKLSNGELVWSKNFTKEWNGRMMSGWGYSESPLVDGNLVLCTPGSNEAMIVALDKKTGSEVWRTAVPKVGDRGGDGAGYSSIVISNAAGVKQYVQLIGRGVIGVRASDGKYLWGYNGVANGTANISTPLVSGDYVFASTGYGTGSALIHLTKNGDGIAANEVYFLKANVFENHHGGMVLIGGHVYGGQGSNNGIPTCVDLKTGKVTWGGKRGPGGGSAAVTAADGNLIFRYQDGAVALISATPDGYHLKGSFKPEYQERESWAHPVVAGGKLFLREQNKMMCYDLVAPK